MHQKRGISSTVAMASIVVLIIIAAAGWAAYAAFPSSKTITSTQTVSGTGSGGSTTVTQTVTQSLTGSATASASTYLSPTTSSVSFTVVGFTLVPNFADWYVVQNSGLAKHYVPGATFTSLAGAQISQALLSGSAQMAMSDPSTFVPSVAKGSSIQLVADLESVPLTWGFVVAGNSTYHTLSDLHGKIFTTTTLGSASADLTQAELQSLMGWKINTDYTLTPLGSVAAQNAAVLSGAAQSEILPVQSVYSYLISGQFRSVYNFSLPYPPNTLWATTSFIQQHPDAVKATVEAFLQAGILWNDNATLGVDLLKSQYNLSPAAATYTYSQIVYSTDGAMSISQNQQVVNVLLAGGAISNNISIADSISPLFAPITY